jgi:hypothetical protein
MAGRKFSRTHLNAFLEQVQSNVGGYYKDIAGKPVEFVRPLSFQYVRVQCMKTGKKRNVDYRHLTPMNEMEVLGYMIPDEETNG